MKDKAARFLKASEFFKRNGSVWMRLSKAAAYDVTSSALDNGILIGMIEGGVWQGPGFMPRTGCIWSSTINPPVDEGLAAKSNRDAGNFILATDLEIDTFILTSFHFR